MIILYLNIQLFKIIDYVFFQLLQILGTFQRNPLFLAFFLIVEICENT